MYGVRTEISSTGSSVERARTTSSCKPANSAAKPIGPSYLLLATAQVYVNYVHQNSRIHCLVVNKNSMCNKKTKSP